ncbi:acyltransferase family protein [Holdemanella biformis]|uniref:acyltransferase family protein n=1 Tax=Holdemanella biformis TaxID=1735 RepID=UPI003CCC7DA4
MYIANQISSAGIADTAFHGFAEQIKQLIYTFHMLAFFALSGTLLYSQLKNGRFNSVTEVVKNKISRLVVPFVFVYLFWNTPIKIFSGYYKQSENIWKDILM